MLKVVVYTRVSSDKQELEQQVAACKRLCEYKQLQIAAEYSEVASGAKAKRPQYLKMLAELRQGLYDGVVVFRLDRLGRNARELALLIDELENRGIKVLSVSENFDTGTAIGRAMREIIIVFAQLEREQIGEATKQRLAALKAGGKRLGQAPASSYQVEKIKELASQGLSSREIAAQMHLSHVTVWRVVSQKGYYQAKVTDG